MCEQKDMSQSKEVAKTSPSKAIGKRPLAPPGFEKSEVCKKMRAEAEPPNTDHLRFVQDLFAEVKTEDTEQLKRTMAAFWEITNNFLAMGRKNAELHQQVEAAKVEKAMASKIAELYEVAKKEVAAAKVVAENALKKVKDLDNRTEKAEKEIAATKAVAENAVQKAKDADKRAALQEMSFIQINNNYHTMVFKNAELHRDAEVAKEELAAATVKAEEWEKRDVNAKKGLEEWNEHFNDYCRSASKKTEESNKRAEKAEKAVEDWKKTLEEWKEAFNILTKKAEESGKRAEKAEKALKDVKIAFKNYSESAIGGIGKALQDFENAVARA